ncbi:MAG: chorismate mutase [Calditrichia bacterium]
MSKQSPRLEVLTRSEWVPENDKPLIIAGPCSAESEEQVLATAHAVAKVPGVKIFRAGVWKPRTRPGDFEGHGVQALQWLKRAKEETGLLTACEVANTNHVYEALKFGVDVLWIGARTSVNPFSVQEIANALSGVDVPVWVKNPVNPDLQLWIGALERMSNAGIKRLGAIHRGFSVYSKMPYRNAPKWDIAIELKRIAPEIPLICDPSHIAGKRDLVREVSQKALDMAMNGLMIETHVDPEKAWSDSAQQVTPDSLKDLLDSLTYRKEEGEGNGKEILVAYRSEIDILDQQLLDILYRRNQISEKIGQYKKDHNMAILQVGRWHHLIEDRLEQARQMGMEDAFVKEIYQKVHENSIRIQSKLMNPNGDKKKNGKA